ncbi:MAG: NAD(P)H-dependent oxidoreductase [Candidatus Omnitrophica bacterium]|nr:NAD(P)H-dependent oxidoreductase [Candidatus Omnitrophota bacterium]
MKSAIVYYSYSGNTRKVAEALAMYLLQFGSVEQIELKAPDESKSFLGQCKRAFSHTKAKLEETNYDLSGYDLICFGSPVWAFGPAPAINTYLAKCTGVENKQVVIFTTYGSGAGKQRCMDYMRESLAAKGVKELQQFSVQQFKVKDQKIVLLKIKEGLRLWPNG